MTTPTNMPLSPSDTTALPRWMTDWRVWLLPIAVLLLIQVKWWWIPKGDATGYLSIARHMAQGHLARLDQAHLHYAPGYPAVITPAFWFGDRPFFALSLIHLGIAVMLMWGLMRWTGRLFGRAAPLVTAFIMVNTSLWDHYRMTLSELALMTWMVWSVEAMYAAEKPAHPARRIGMVLLAVFAAAMAALTRQVGVFVIAGLGMRMLALGWRQEMPWRRAIPLAACIGVPVAALLFGWIVFDHQVAQRADVQGKSYAEFMAPTEGGTLAGQVTEAVRLRISEVGRLLIPGMNKAYARPYQWLNVNVGLHLAATVVMLIGWWKLARDSWDPLVLALPFYTLIYLIWPFDQGTRYMLPMLPVLAAGWWVWLARWPNLRHQVWVVLIVIHLLVACISGVRGLREKAYHVHWAAMDVFSAELDASALPGDVVVSVVPDGEIAMMMAVASDRTIWPPTLTFSAGGSPGERQASEGEPAVVVNWVVMPADAEPPTGYRIVRAHGAFALARLNTRTDENP